LLVLVGGVFLLHYVQSDRSVDALRWQAENAANEGKVEKAILYTSQYLEFRPDDHEAAANLGDMILKRARTQKEFTNALFIFEKVNREAPEREDVRRKLVEICLKIGRYTDATIQLKTLLKNHPTEPELWEQQAVCQAALNQFEDARKSFETAIASDPARIQSYDLLARLFNDQMDLHDDAKACIEKMVKVNPRDPKAYLVRARFLRSEKNGIDDALRDVKYLLVLDKNNADGLLMFAEIMQGRGEIDPARKALADGIKEHPKDVRFYRALAWLELNLNNLPAGIACLEDGIQKLPFETELLTPLADFYAQQGEMEKAEAIIKKLETRRVVPLQVSYLKARVLMQRGKYADALTLFEPLRTQAVGSVVFSTQINLLMAVCFQKMGNREAQEETLGRVLSLDGSNQTARLQMGYVYIANGQLDEAIKEFTSAANSPTALMSTRIMLGRLLMAKARSSKSDNWNRATNYAEDLVQKHPQSADPILLKGEILLARKQYDEAKKFLREVSGTRLQDSRIWALRAAVAHETNGLYEAIDVLDEAQSLLGDSVELRLARAKLWSADWQSGQGDRILALGQSIENLPDSDQLRLLANLGEICSNRGDRAGVKHFYSEIAARMPKELPIRLVLFEFAAKDKDEAVVNRLRNEIAKLEPAGSDLLAVAEALAFDTDTPAIRTLVERKLKTYPDRADAHLLAAKLAEKDGDLKLAQRHLDQAIEFDRGNLRYLQAELAFLLRTKQDSAASAIVTRTYYDPRMTALGFRSFIEVGAEQDSQNVEQCLSWLRPSVERDLSSCLWAAQYAQRHGKSKIAAELLAVARTLAPKQLDVWVLSCLRTNNTAEQLTQLVEAGKKALDGRVYYLLCAEIEKSARKVMPTWKPPLEKPEDQRVYAQAYLNSMSIRNKRQEAVDFLKEFLINSVDRPSDAAWASRNIAMLNATSGTAQERREAIESLRKAGAEPGSIDEMRSRVTGLAIASRQLGGAERRAVLDDSIALLKQIVQSKEATPRDWYNLGQLYRLTGQRGEYRQTIKDLMQRDPSNLYYVVVYVDDLLDAGELTEAEKFTDRLAKAASDSRAVSTLARFHCLKNDSIKCLELVEQFLKSAESGTSESMSRLRQMADLLDKLARQSRAKHLNDKPLVQAALEKYQVAIRYFPEAVSPMAGLLAFDGTVTDAFDLLTRMKPNLSAKLLTSAGLTVLSNGRATPQQFQMVHQWIEAGLTEQPNSAPLWMNLAGIHALRQEYAAAADAYDRLLKIEPDNIVALNNRAWILAANRKEAPVALKLIDHAIELVGPTDDLLDTRARIRMTLGENDLAVEDLIQALNQSQSSLHYFHLALAQWNLGKRDEAKKTFKQAQSRGLDPRSIHPDDARNFQVMLTASGS
jgi:tetratricopeptide (TPR) repeat protein